MLGAGEAPREAAHAERAQEVAAREGETDGDLGRGLIGRVGGVLRGRALGMERVQAYSDAVLSIIATILVVPTTKLSERAEREILVTGGSLFGVLTTPYRLQSFLMCWVSFWVVFLVFVWHGQNFRGLENAHGLVVFANWLKLLATGLLPVTTANAANVSSDRTETLDIRMSMVRELFFNVLFIAIAHFLFHAAALYSQKQWFTQIHLAEAAAIVLVCTATVLASYSLEAGYCFMLYIAVAPIMWYASRQLRRRRAELWLDEDALEMEEKNREVFRKRLEAFTDGVLAISATLIVLEVQPVPACSDLLSPDACILKWSDGCRPMWNPTPQSPFKFACVFDDEESWEKKNWMILAFIVSFCVINVLWTLHHTLVDSITAGRNLADFWTLALNGHFCFAVALLPFGFSLVTDYGIKPVKAHKFNPAHFHDKVTPDEEAASTALVITSLFLFIASGCLLAMMGHHHLKRALSLKPRDLLLFSALPVLALVIGLCTSSAQNKVVLWPFAILPLAVGVLRWFIP